MPKLPQLSGRNVVKIFQHFQHFGWQVARQQGSHIILVKDGHNATLSVPAHKEAAQGTLRGLIRSAVISVEAFIEISRQL
jgi:predicted RNA binding protein YcfA (HicA-like mRNA interferase family)